MNIVYISNSSAPSILPSSLQIVKTCEALSQIGNNVILIIPNTKKIDINFSEFYNIKYKFTVIILRAFKEFPRGLNYYLFSLVTVLKSIFLNTNIIITRNFFIIFLCRFFRLNCILELHHDIKVEGRVIKFLVKNTNFLNSRKVLKIVAISQSIKNYYINNYKVSEKKIIVLPSGSSLKTKFQIKIKKKLDIGYFGSLSSSKGVDLILALSRLDKKNNYWIYGGYSNSINSLVLKNENNNLHLGKYLSYKKLLKKMSNMDILLLPYKNIVHSAGDVDNIVDFTSPLKLFDYLACGKLILCSNLAIFKEIVKDKKNCILVDNFNSPFSWFKEIKKIENNFYRRFIISKNAYNLSKKFNHKIRVKDYLNKLNLQK
jgi:glycosyltransferase involved in cell wall biosynthesis